MLKCGPLGAPFPVTSPSAPIAGNALNASAPKTKTPMMNRFFTTLPVRFPHRCARTTDTGRREVVTQSTQLVTGHITCQGQHQGTNVYKTGPEHATWTRQGPDQRAGA